MIGIVSYFDRAVGSSHSNETSGEFHFENFSNNQNVIFISILSLICSINHLSDEEFTRKIFKRNKSKLAAS